MTKCGNLSLSYSFSTFPPEMILNIFQIVHLIIGVYNTKAEPELESTRRLFVCLGFFKQIKSILMRAPKVQSCVA